MTPEDVVAEYLKWHSIKETARRMNINYSVVRKCLVTHTYFSDNPSGCRIRSVRAVGAAELSDCCSRRTRTYRSNTDRDKAPKQRKRPVCR